MASIASSSHAALTHNSHLESILAMIRLQWGLPLWMPNIQDSPRTRKERGLTVEEKCIARIKFLHFKDRLSPATVKFDEQAKIIYKGWVDKPKGERGLLPRTSRQLKHPTTAAEKMELLQLLLELLDEEFVKFPHTPSFNRRVEDLDDRPILSQLPKSSRKRSSGDRFVDDQVNASAKKQRQPEFASTSAHASAGMPPPRSTRRTQELPHDTSFISETSSVFSAPSLRNFESNETQTTTPDEESAIPTQPNSRPPSPCIQHPSSSGYGSSSMDQVLRESFGETSACDNSFLDELKEDMPQGLNHSASEIVKQDKPARVLHGRLMEVFPKLNPSLEYLPFAVLYEITRICLFNAVPMDELEFTLPPNPDYDTLWSSLQQHPLLQGKPFPPRCHREVWSAAMKDFTKGTRAVVFSGSLSYATDSNDPFYQLRLEPMRFDGSYRLGRRHGNDRFFELDFPQMSGRKAPAILQSSDRNGQVLLVSWLVDGVHKLFGRTWKPFHIKPKERRGRKAETRGDEDFDTAHRLFFFAVNGHEFQVGLNPFSRAHLKMTISDMLDTARPIQQNMDEKFLKLFARSDLVVSKNTPTVVLNKSQIIFKRDILCNEEVMTDGAGQISYKLAQEVTQKLGLSFVPSGFQGRIGQAKGFWSVDYLDLSGKAWISVYGSQCKWTTLEGDDHESHRTFEVLRHSAPLKAADLNLQLLPILQARANHPLAMEAALKDLLKDGLQRQLDDLQKAMNDPQAFRVWLRATMSSSGERLKNECVQYRAGLPTSIEEKLILFLDAGFDPNKLYFLQELARKAFKAKCDGLKKRLNITVSRSSYVYMVPDFSETLQENEVYLDFSSFTDESSEFSNANVLLNGVDILVARLPAHYVSDIQKVRAIHRVELVGLKDVIVFPTKGNPSLAAKLSGGDYDGDIAWVCWEPTIVENFQNACIPKVPNLVKEGLIKKDSTTYKQLVECFSSKSTSASNPTSIFLNASFFFNMQQNMLGICTSFKEHLCYTMGTVDSKEAVYLSTLLGSLVDQAKQGYIFTEEDWNFFKSKKITQKVQMPSYKTDQVNRRSRHIIDRLIVTAEETIGRLLTELEKSTPKAPILDDDLATYYHWAKNKAQLGKNSEWYRLVTDLNTDLQKMMDSWSRNRASVRDGKAQDTYLPDVDKVYEEFINIKPHFNSCFTEALLPDCLKDAGSSDWALLRASALFANFKGKPVPSYVWNIAGIQLAKLKPRFGSSGGMAHSVVPNMYAMLRPDAAYVKKARSQRDVGIVVVDENCSIVNADEMENLED